MRPMTPNDFETPRPISSQTYNEADRLIQEAGFRLASLISADRVERGQEVSMLLDHRWAGLGHEETEAEALAVMSVFENRFISQGWAHVDWILKGSKVLVKLYTQGCTPRRSARLDLRLLLSEKASWQRQARMAGMGMSQWVCSVVNNAVGAPDVSGDGPADP